VTALLVMCVAMICISPELYSSYAGFLYGTLTDNMSTGLVEGGVNQNLSVKTFFEDLQLLVFGDASKSPWPFWLWEVLVGYFIFRLKRISWEMENKISLAVILLLLIFPRLKNYTYILMTVPIIILYGQAPLIERCAVLAMANVIPLALPLFWSIGYQFDFNSTGGKICYFLITYSYLYAALGVVFFTWIKKIRHLESSKIFSG
jgi:hypothetical protein